MDAIIAFDADGRITLFNTSAEDMFGTPAEEAMKADVRMFFPEPMQQEILDDICSRTDRKAGSPDDAPRTGEHVMSFAALRKNGEEFPVELTASCLDSRGKRTYTLIIRDISERKRAELELKAQAETLARAMTELKGLNDELAERQMELERAMAARSRFYASMSHELRTPINAVLGYSTLLLENIYGPLNEKQTEGITRTHKAAKHLLELVNDVLDLSKIEAGKIDLRLQPVTFPALIEDLFVTVRPLADQYGSSLSIEHDGEQVKVVSDPRRLRQILLNLLSNAIKFGRGKPIRVRSMPREDGGLVLEVIDQGEGIAQQDRDKIFDEFVQLGKTQLTEGTGLGLPISRRLAEMLQGQLEIESVVGEGSTFRLTLPQTADNHPLRNTRNIEVDAVTSPVGDLEETDVEAPVETAATREPGAKTLR
jgi:PAS domain S-box-containing protein